MTQPAPLSDPGLADALRRATHAAHQRLDQAIMAADPFSGPAGYARLLEMQHALHAEVAPLYQRADLAALVPGLAARCRLAAVQHDGADLGLRLSAPPPAAELPRAEALGWLYVVEGSNLGAAFLLKAAQKMGMTETHGARHLAEAPEGRAAQWRGFRAALDAAPAQGIAPDAVIAGAEAAFARAQALAQRYMG